MKSDQEKTFKHKVAKIVSLIFIPPHAVFWSMFLLATIEGVREPNLLWLSLISALFGFFLPIAVFILLMKQKKISDSEARIKEERTVPYFIGILLLISGLLIMYSLDINHYSISLWSSYLIMNILIIIVNRLWKISAHAAGVAVPLGAFAAVNTDFILPLFIIVMIVSWARVVLKCHTIAQVAAGALIGASVSFINLKIV